VVVFAMGVTIFTGLVFGLAPAWQSANIDVNTTLKAGGRSASGGLRPLLRKSLACAELALATVLLVGAVLLVRSLLELQRVPLGLRVVSPGYFQTVKIPILRGRDFTDSDTDKAPSVMIVSRATARTLSGDEDPIGRTIRRVADRKDFTVVGVVGDVRSTSLN